MTGAPDGECCVEKRSTQKVLEKGRMEKVSIKSKLRSPERVGRRSEQSN